MILYDFFSHLFPKMFECNRLEHTSGHFLWRTDEITYEIMYVSCRIRQNKSDKKSLSNNHGLFYRTGRIFILRGQAVCRRFQRKLAQDMFSR